MHKEQRARASNHLHLFEKPGVVATGFDEYLMAFQQRRQQLTMGHADAGAVGVELRVFLLELADFFGDDSGPQLGAGRFGKTFSPVRAGHEARLAGCFCGQRRHVRGCDKACQHLVQSG